MDMQDVAHILHTAHSLSTICTYTAPIAYSEGHSKKKVTGLEVLI
jgi:hypothetical protein